MDFKYLITVFIRKGSVKTFTFLYDILVPFGVVADQEIAERSKNYKISTLIVTSRRWFENCVLMEFEKGQTTFVDLEFCHPHQQCQACFPLDHSV